MGVEEAHRVAPDAGARGEASVEVLEQGSSAVHEASGPRAGRFAPRVWTHAFQSPWRLQYSRAVTEAA